MESHELRSEIQSGGQRYHIQTHLVPSQRCVVTSLFHEGRLLSKQIETYNQDMPREHVSRLVRHCHEEKKNRIGSLLAIRDKLGRSDDTRAHLKLGEALYHQSLYKEAMSEIVRAVKLGCEEAKAYAILGNCLHAVGDYEKAIKSFKKGIALAPEYPDLYNDLGGTYLQLRRCREAVDTFEKAIELNKYYQDAYLNLAVALCLNVVAKEDFELARDLRARLRQILEKVLQLKPSLDTAEFRRALEAVGEEDYEAAYMTLSRIKEEGKKVATDNLSLDLYLILKFNSESMSEEEIDGYIEKTERALEANPDYADLQNALGILYTAKCKLFIDKANESFQKALKINRNFRKAEKNLKLAINDRKGIHFLLKALLD